MEFTYETSITCQGEEYYAELFIDVTNVVVVPPDHNTWDSAEDYFGTREMEWEVLSVKLFGEDGDITLTEFELDYDKIEAWAWEVLEEMKGDDYDY